MDYIFIDTNIYLLCTLVTEERHDWSVIAKLRRVLSEDRAVLVVPEVVALEYIRLERTEFEKTRQSILALKKQLDLAEWPSYLNRSKQDVGNRIQQLLDERSRNREQANDDVQRLFQPHKTAYLRLTPEIMMHAYRRALRGLKPFKPEQSGQVINADCMIVENLLDYMADKSHERLLFCSQNVRDFAQLDNDLNKHVLHPDISESLYCEVVYFNSLYDLLESIFDVAVSEEERGNYSAVESDLLAVSEAAEDVTWIARRVDPEFSQRGAVHRVVPLGDYSLSLSDVVTISGPPIQIARGASYKTGTPMHQLSGIVRQSGGGEILFEIVSQPHAGFQGAGVEKALIEAARKLVYSDRWKRGDVFHLNSPGVED